MANFVDMIPSGLKAGDTITLQTSGTYSAPGYLVVSISVCGGPGGNGQNISYASSKGGTLIQGTCAGGKGGAGGMATFERKLDLSNSLTVEIGATGTTKAKGVGTRGVEVQGEKGGTGGTTTAYVGGVLAATATGGTGGTGARVYVYHDATYVVYKYDGVAGANGTVTTKPVNATAGISPYTAGCVVLTVLSTNAAPSDPKDITYGDLYAARPVDVTWTPSIDPEGETITYALEYRFDSGVYTTVATTTEPRATVTIPAQGTTGQFRVKAVDPKGGESGYVVGIVKPIIYNFDPTISGSDEDKGEINTPFSYSFSVDDQDIADVLRFSVYLDGAEIMSVENAVRNQTYTVPLETMRERWPYLVVGRHCLWIECYDNNGAGAYRYIDFARVCDRLELETLHGVITGEMVNTVMPFFNYEAPADATVLFQLRNDPAAPWEDVTENNYGSEIYTFQNTVKTTSGDARLDARVYIVNAANNKEGEIYFYGATLLLNANGNDSPIWASSIKINPQDLTPGGALQASDTNVMQALNTLSIAAQSAGLRILGRYASLAALQAAIPTGAAGDLYVVTDGATTTAYFWDIVSGAWVETPGISGVPGIPGRDGIDGKDGHGLLILGQYADLDSLKAAQPAPTPGDCYAVGLYAPYNIFCATESGTWINLGPLQGSEGSGGGTSGGGSRRTITGQVFTPSGWTVEGDGYSYFIADAEVTADNTAQVNWMWESLGHLASLKMYRNVTSCEDGGYRVKLDVLPTETLTADVVIEGDSPGTQGIHTIRNTTFPASGWVWDAGLERFTQAKAAESVTADMTPFLIIDRLFRADLVAEIEVDTAQGAYYLSTKEKPATDIVASIVLLKGAEI